jgi:hypothetical protein
MITELQQIILRAQMSETKAFWIRIDYFVIIKYQIN